MYFHRIADNEYTIPNFEKITAKAFFEVFSTKFIKLYEYVQDIRLKNIHHQIIEERTQAKTATHTFTKWTATTYNSE